MKENPVSRKGRLSELWSMLGRTIYTGDRLKANLLAITTVSLFCAVLGIVLIFMNLFPRSGSVNLLGLVMSVVTFLAGSGCAFLSHVRKNRGAAVLIPTFFCIGVFTYYALSGYREGTGILWSLMLPIGMCYFISIRSGIILSLYYSVFYMVVFYTPLGNNMAQYYTEAFMLRFPLAFASLSVFTIIAMIQYHRTALLEIDYTDRLNREVARQTAVAEERSRRIEQMSFHTIQTLANAIDAKDPYTKGHSTRVSQYAVAVAEALGWPQERISDLRYAALLHDIGKIGVPDSILNNPDKLSDVEYDIIKSHTTMGAEILRSRIMVSAAEDVAQSHHERYDGTGYPHGLKGTEISEEARIVAIADAFDAMSSNRIYRRACSPDHILRELQEGRGRQFDPEYVSLFTDLWMQGKLDQIIRSEAPAEQDSLDTSSALLRDVMESFVSQNLDQTDPVTGLLNRASGESAIARAMEENSGCFVFFDMDNLKKINDIHSHQAGDRALKSLGEALSAGGEHSPACRLGGDEFLLFLRGVTREQAEEQVRGIMQDFIARVAKDQETAEASLSAGMVMCTPADSFSRAYNKADKALYYVKQNGKNGLSFYQEESDSWQSGLVDISRLMNSIRHSGSYDGAMDVEYRQFTRLYEFFIHLRQRCHHPFRLVMITLKADDRETPRMEELEKAMYYMEQAIRQAVRNVDVLTRYSRQQYLIIMLDTDDSGVKTAVDRIFRSFFKMSGGGIFSPSYTVADPEEEGPAQA